MGPWGLPVCRAFMRSRLRRSLMVRGGSWVGNVAIGSSGEVGMPKPRHENRFAERAIVERGLPGWRSRTQLAAEAAAADARERERAELERRQGRATELAAEAVKVRARSDRAARRADTPERRRLAYELAADARAAERAALAAAGLVPVAWDDLSPAELAFRWMLSHHHVDEWREPSEYSLWARERREVWKTAQSAVATTVCEPTR